MARHYRQHQPRTGLQAARRASGDTQDTVAAYVADHCPGHDRNGSRQPCAFDAYQLSKIERGERGTSPGHIGLLCDYYQRPPEQLSFINWHRTEPLDRPTSEQAATGASPPTHPISDPDPEPRTPQHHGQAPPARLQRSEPRGHPDDWLAELAGHVLDAERAAEESTPMERRTFIGGAGIAAAGAATDPLVALVKLDRDRIVRTDVDNEQLDRLEGTVRRYARTFPDAQPGPLSLAERYMVEVFTDWSGAGRLLKLGMTTRQRQRLHRVYAGFAGILGLILFDFAQYRRAAEIFHAGQDAARQSGDGDLEGWLFGAESLIPMFTGDPGGVLELTEQGLLAVGGAKTRTAAWLHDRAMRAHAALVPADSSHFRKFEEHLAAAHDALDAASGGAWDGGDGYRPTGRFHYAVTCGVGRAYLDAGDPKQALALAEDEARHGAAYPDKSATYVTSSTLNQALIVAACGDPGAAAELGSRALVAFGGHNRNVLVRARELRAALAPHQDLPAVAEYSDHLVDRARSLRALPPPA